MRPCIRNLITGGNPAYGRKRLQEFFRGNNGTRSRAVVKAYKEIPIRDTAGTDLPEWCVSYDKEARGRPRLIKKLGLFRSTLQRWSSIAYNIEHVAGN